MTQSQVIKEKLQEYFKQDAENISALFHQLSLHIYEIEAYETDLHILAKILPEEYLKKLIAYYDGDIIKMPTKENYQTCLFLALCYYFKEIKGWSWNRIKDFLNLPEHNQDLLNPIMIGRKINKIKKNIQKYLLSILKNNNFEEKELKRILNFFEEE
jgi:hypothetical protein